MLIDTHCHIHESDYPLDIKQTLNHAVENGVDHMLCVGTSLDSSTRAIAFAKDHPQAHATIGVHPHDTKDGWEEIGGLIDSADSVYSVNGFAPGLTGAPASGQTQSADVFGGKEAQSNLSEIVAIGEIGLDYYYTHSPRETQIEALRWQIDLALKNNLPIVFHVRDAFDDFWPIFDSFSGIRGVLHSFTDNQKNLGEGLKRGLYIGVNGISTFTKDKTQQELFTSIPLASLLLETDAPFLTPAPLRGQTNEPAFVKNIAEYHAKQRGISVEELSSATTANARALFGL